MPKKQKKSVHWLVTLITILCDSTISAVDIPNPHDITIYNKVDKYPDYLTIIDRFNSEITMKDLIKQANQD